jgi:hypothetical protein
MIFALLICTGDATLAMSGLKALTVEAGARPVGMGGAFTSIAADPYSAAYNPAGVRGITRFTGSAGYNTYWENRRIETGYVAFEKRAVTFSAGIQFAAIDDMEARQIASDDFLEFNAHDVSIKAGAAFELEDNYYLGIALGYMNEKIDTYSDFAFNFDLGLLMQPYPRLNIGLSVLNFGATMNLNEESYDLPTMYRGGISYSYDKLTAALDLVRHDGDVFAHIGGEYGIQDMFFIRAGYRTGYDTKDFSAGAGFFKRNFRLDYAFLPQGILGDSHLINLTIEI